MNHLKKLYKPNIKNAENIRFIENNVRISTLNLGENTIWNGTLSMKTEKNLFYSLKRFSTKVWGVDTSIRRKFFSTTAKNSWSQDWRKAVMFEITPESSSWINLRSTFDIHCLLKLLDNWELNMNLIKPKKMATTLIAMCNICKISLLRHSRYLIFP